MKNFGEFYDNQIASANAIILSRTSGMTAEKIDEVVAMLREKNATAIIVTTPWDMLDGKKILEVIDGSQTPMQFHDDEDEHEHHHHHNGECCCHNHDEDEHEHHHHHEHDECDDPECECHHHHHHNHDDDEHEHHHHDNECCCHNHEHEHHHHDHDECDDPECECHHHHHHHADEVFESIGAETTKKFTIEEIKEKLETLNDTEKYGKVLRAKGIVASDGDKFIYFDFVPGEDDVREGEPDVIGKLCVIGSKINHEAISELFGVKLKA